MSCEQGASGGGGGGRYRYSHDETATIRLYPSSGGGEGGAPSSSSSYSSSSFSPPRGLNSRVSLESSSTLRSTGPIFHRSAGAAADDGGASSSPSSWSVKRGAALLSSGTPFSGEVLDLLSAYPLRRLLIRVGDAASASSSVGGGGGGAGGEGVDELRRLLPRQEERSGGPSGTSVRASFAHWGWGRGRGHGRHDGDDDNNHIGADDVAAADERHYRNRYASLLRHLLDRGLFPPCGAPLDSPRVRKHGHVTIVHAPNYDGGTTETGGGGGSGSGAGGGVVDVESVLPADGAAFCDPGVRSLLLAGGEDGGRGGWGSAADNGACRPGGDVAWGLFGSVSSFSPNAAAPASGGTVLSELLLGASPDSAPREYDGAVAATDRRHSVWIDLHVSRACFDDDVDSLGKGDCTVKVTRGASYRIAVPPPAAPAHTFNLSLGDMIVGHDTLTQAMSKEGWKAWYPCPLSESSRILLHVPKGFTAAVKGGVDAISHDHDADTGMLAFDALAWKDGRIDLTAPWAELHPVNETKIADEVSSAPSSFGISRTVKRPLGVASSGTLVSVVRYDQFENLELGQSQLVEVQSLDVLPGTLVKPRMHTLRMVLYQGGGAGGNRFAPPLDSESDLCECQYSATTTSSGSDMSSNQCGVTCQKRMRLLDMPDHSLVLHSDGTTLLKRTFHLPPDSSLWMMVDFDEAYLPFQRFPADANRGVDVFPSQATFTLLATPPVPPTTLYSPSLLLLPPVPDMSMPFNVISLSCTLWAFVLGSLLNILVRRGTESAKRELTGEKEKRPLDKLKDKIREKGSKLKQKLRCLKSRFGNKNVDDQMKGE